MPLPASDDEADLEAAADRRTMCGIHRQRHDWLLRGVLAQFGSGEGVLARLVVCWAPLGLLALVRKCSARVAAALAAWACRRAASMPCPARKRTLLSLSHPDSPLHALTCAGATEPAVFAALEDLMGVGEATLRQRAAALEAEGAAEAASRPEGSWRDKQE